MLADAALRVEEVRDAAALERLRPEWDALWARVPGATPFQSAAWLLPWWRHVGEGELLTLAVRDGGALAGVLPFYIYAHPEDGLRRLFPLGIGTTDYLDALAAPGEDAAVMRAALAHLRARRGSFDLCEWPQLRPGSPLLAGAAPAGWADRVEPAEPCPALRLPTTVGGLREVVSGKTLRDLRTARARAAAAAAGAVRWEDADDPAAAGEMLDALLRLHAARWATRGEAGVLADPRVQAAHREAVPTLLRAGLLRFHALRLDGRVAAALYALADPPGRAERRMYLYLQGFDPALERLSPGLLLVGHAVERAIEDGFAVADFLRGRERYKAFWGAREEPTWRRVLEPPPA